MKAHLNETGPFQPFLKWVGETKNSVNNFYIVPDQKVISYMIHTAVDSINKLFMAHFAFAVSCIGTLFNFYEFIQTNMYGMDVGSGMMSHQVKEIRAGIIQSAEIAKFKTAH